MTGLRASAALSPRQRVALSVWGTAARVLSLVLPVKLWWRGRREPGYRAAVAERTGRYDTAPSAGWLWLHAVSLGETRAALPLVAALRAAHPGLRLLLSSSTATGREAGRALLQEGDRQVWLPFDTPGAVRRFLDHHRPRVGVLMETEVWPCLLQAARERDLPVVLANARLSDKSLRQSLRLDALFRPAVASLAAVLAQTQDDAERLVRAGAVAQRVRVCGNLKYDLTPAPSALAAGRDWRAASVRPVVLMASSREGEEGPLLQAWAALGEARPRLLLVPRHPQRFDDVEAMVRGAGLTISRRSRWPDGRPDAQALGADVWLGDSMGEMPRYYAAADVALLGGSFAPLGGQNLIEAAACGCPLLMGPHTFNFDEAARLSEGEGAARRVADLGAAVAQAVALCADAPMRDAMIQAASRFSAAHRGAAARMADAMGAWLEAPRA